MLLGGLSGSLSCSITSPLPDLKDSPAMFSGKPFAFLLLRLLKLILLNPDLPILLFKSSEVMASLVSLISPDSLGELPLSKPVDL